MDFQPIQSGNMTILLFWSGWRWFCIRENFHQNVTNPQTKNLPVPELNIQNMSASENVNADDFDYIDDGDQDSASDDDNNDDYDGDDVFAWCACTQF